MQTIKTYGLPLFISVYFVIIAGFNAASIAPFEAPDEGAHLSYVRHMLTTGELPVLADNETMWTVKQGELAGHHPPLYYLTVALPVQFLDVSQLPSYFNQNPFAAVGQFSYANQNAYLHPLSMPDDTLLAVDIARAISIGLTLGTLWMIYLTAYIVRDNRLFAAGVMLFAASIPTFVFIGSSINNDNLATFIFAAGTVFCVRIWKARIITWRDGVLLGVLLGGAALTKLNTLFLFVVVGIVVLAGLLTGRFSWRDAIIAGLISGAMSATFAGWWYWRNFQLYNDPFAIDATVAVWGRGAPPSWAQLQIEMRGVWESFWYTLGNLNIRADDWFYQYINVVVAIGLAGFAVQVIRDNKHRSFLLILLFIFSVTVLALVLATRSINVSQGRILFPGLAALTTMLAIGWQFWLRRWFWLPIVPLTILTMLAPFTQLQPTYRFPEAVEALPAEASPLEVSAEGIVLEGYHFQPTHISGQDVVTVDLYIRGNHPDNPTLFIKLIDPVSGVPVGGVDTYPPMTTLNQLDPDQMYHIRTRFAVDDARVTGFFSRELIMRIGWRRFDREQPEIEAFIPWTDANNNTIDALLVDAPAFINRDFVPDVLANPVDVRFGQAIQLTGYEFSTDTVAAGESVTMTTNWQAIGIPQDDYVISVGVLDDENVLVAQADAPPAFFPTDTWLEGLQHQDTRMINLPDDLPAGTYTLYITLYRRSDFARLPVSGAGADGDVYRLSESLMVVD